MIPRPPISTRTARRFPYTTLCRSAGHAQVQAQVEALRALRADLVEIPATPRAQREAAAELVLAQSALDDQDAVAREQLRELEVGFGEERALAAAAAVFQRHARLRLAALADAAHLAGDDHGGFRPPAEAFIGRAVVLAGGPQRVELAEVAAEQRRQLVAVGIQGVAPTDGDQRCGTHTE